MLVHTDPAIIYLKIDSETLKTSAEYLFYVIDNAPWRQAGEVAGWWAEASDLAVGDAIRQADGTTGMVQAVVVVERRLPMYNLTIAEAHTFFVGDQQWLVHNCGGSKKGGRYKELDAQGGKYHRHHMPANDASPLSHGDGPAILMEPEDHMDTASWGSSKLAKLYRTLQEDLIAQGRFDDAIQMDIDDILQKFGDKYVEHILEMINSLE